MTLIDGWAAVVGQESAARQLRAAAAEPVHAYLLLGSEGRGARALARAFAADLLAAGLDAPAAERARSLALVEHHADFVVIEPGGNMLRDDEVGHVVGAAHRSPIEGGRKVILVTRFHTANDKALTQLLKVVEEPPASTVFVLLVDELEPRLATIASRCVTIELDPVPEVAIAAALEAEGIQSEAAARAAGAAGGDVERARLLAGDERLALRVDAWRRVPEQLDGTGHVVWKLVAELQASIADALAHLEKRFSADESELARQLEEVGGPKARLKELVDAHKRELRRARAAELRLGLAALARRYRDAVVGGPGDPVRHRQLVDVVGAIDKASEMLVLHNPNETLLLQALLLRLPPLR